MKFEDEKGYLIVASNNSDTDYVLCARVLAKSIKKHMPDSKVCLLTDKLIEDDTFDYIKTFPYGDVSGSDWKLDNDWQSFYATPFRETIKIEADMLITSDISHWWDILRHRDVVVATSCRDFKGNISENRHYRKIFDLNNLPNMYNAITYWRFSQTATDFFKLVRTIFENWDDYKTLLVGANDEEATTDVVYAIAGTLLGVEQVTLPNDVISLVHMKSKINNITCDDWRKQLVWEVTDKEFRINTVTQQYPVHYHIKDFAKDLENIYV